MDLTKGLVRWQSLNLLRKLNQKVEYQGIAVIKCAAVVGMQVDMTALVSSYGRLALLHAERYHISSNIDDIINQLQIGDTQKYYLTRKP